MMTVNNRKINQINDIIEMLRERKQELVDACPHENGLYDYKGNTGNYDPSCDCYWIDATCLDCGKMWHVDSERDHTEYCTLQDRKGWTPK